MTTERAFFSMDDLLDWSERHGNPRPVVEQGPDRTFRGSVEHDNDKEEIPCPA